MISLRDIQGKVIDSNANLTRYVDEERRSVQRTVEENTNATQDAITADRMKAAAAVAASKKETDDKVQQGEILIIWFSLLVVVVTAVAAAGVHCLTAVFLCCANLQLEIHKAR